MQKLRRSKTSAKSLFWFVKEKKKVLSVYFGFPPVFFRFSLRIKFCFGPFAKTIFLL